MEIPKKIESYGEQLDYCLRPYGMMKREIMLEDGWYKDAYGPVIGKMKESGEQVALLPGKIRGYYFTDVKTGRRVKLDSRTEKLLEREAYCFYKPLPQRKIGVRVLLMYMKGCVNTTDVAFTVIATLALVLVGKLIPHITQALTGPVLANGSTSMLIASAVCLFCTALSSQLISSVKGMIMSRIQTKTSLGIQSSMMMRIMSLPAPFFRDYSAGELMSRSGAVMGAFSSLAGIALSAGKIKPILDMAEPFLETEPETSDGREIVTRISGGIELTVTLHSDTETDEVFCWSNHTCVVGSKDPIG